MSAISLRIPESVHDAVKKLAVKEGVSMNQLIAMAVAEKMSALMTEEYLNARAQRGSRAKFRRALKKVKSVAPMEADRI